MSGDHWSDKLVSLNACPGAVKWSESYATFDEAWQACERGHWMLWLAGKYAGPPGDERRRTLVLAACGCARLALRFVPDGEGRPHKAIEIAERWASGDESVSLGDVRSAADAASAAYAAAAAYAAYAASAAAYAAYAASAADARPGVLKQCADIVRKHYPTFELEPHDER